MSATQNADQNAQETKVIFRKWRNKGGGVIAFFPELPATYAGYEMTCYESIGQHGSADYSYCLSRTRRATPEEYADLYAELESIGYTLKVVKRETYGDYLTRRAEAQR